MDNAHHELSDRYKSGHDDDDERDCWDRKLFAVDIFVSFAKMNSGP